MKRIALVVALLSLSLAACGEKAEEAAPAPTAAPTSPAAPDVPAAASAPATPAADDSAKK